MGSFLNVVVYRWPRRQSLWHPPSTCPQCGKRIRARDNVPIFGWLWLRGKCRDCHLPISARYPLVEATTAAVFALIYWRDVVAVPVELPESQRWFWFAWHTSLVCLLLVSGLIRFDRQNAAVKIACSGLSLALLLLLWQPDVIVRVHANYARFLLAVTLGVATDWTLRRRGPRWRRRGTSEPSEPSAQAGGLPGHGSCSGLLLGLFLGWWIPGVVKPSAWLMELAVGRPIGDLLVAASALVIILTR